MRNCVRAADRAVGTELIAGMFRILLLAGMGIALVAIVGIFTSPIDVRHSWHDESLIIGWAGIGVMVFAIIFRPWLRSRFSLRMLLIATTLVALVLGAIVFAARQ